jgi:hypothetical protein
MRAFSEIILSPPASERICRSIVHSQDLLRRAVDPHQRNENSGIEPALAGGLDLLPPVRHIGLPNLAAVHFSSERPVPETDLPRNASGNTIRNLSATASFAMTTGGVREPALPSFKPDWAQD